MRGRARTAGGIAGVGLLPLELLSFHAQPGCALDDLRAVGQACVIEQRRIAGELRAQGATRIARNALDVAGPRPEPEAIGCDRGCHGCRHVRNNARFDSSLTPACGDYIPFTSVSAAQPVTLLTPVEPGVRLK